ncbi:13576_t:CDS:2 [Ambispora gerdemannii]|uniref:13576_t:CDS:1 n=1 Tax=Ambispora gerdemannii TaxID=144530 RepID=A0A9N8ZRM3_9GLOM|nr:13576_t:CDS:2 [Ambispora gerdemannii]
MPRNKDVGQDGVAEWSESNITRRYDYAAVNETKTSKWYYKRAMEYIQYGKAAKKAFDLIGNQQNWEILNL